MNFFSSLFDLLWFEVYLSDSRIATPFVFLVPVAKNIFLPMLLPQSAVYLDILEAAKR